MKISYSIWQGSLHKGTLTATSMKDILAIIDELNQGEQKLKFEHMVHSITQVA